jgi:hypothetical protein
MQRLINAVLFQLVWFVCLLAGSVWALVATAAYLLLHDRYFMHTRREWRLLGVFLALGIMIDGALFQLGLFSFGANVTSQNSFPPLWLLCLWVSVATLFAHSLAFLRSRYLLASTMGSIGPTLSYFAGANLAGITLADPLWLSLLVVACVWSIVLPFGLFLAEKWALFQQ